jgi:hypothetical protein
MARSSESPTSSARRRERTGTGADRTTNQRTRPSADARYGAERRTATRAEQSSGDSPRARTLTACGKAQDSQKCRRGWKKTMVHVLCSNM